MRLVILPLLLLIGCQIPQNDKRTSLPDSLMNRIELLKNTNKHLRKKMMERERSLKFYRLNDHFIDSAKKFNRMLYNQDKAVNKSFVQHFLHFPYDTLKLENGQLRPVSLITPNKGYLQTYEAYMLHWYSARLYLGYHPVSKYQGDHYFISQFDRSPENIKELFRKYESIIYALLDKESYKKLDLDYIIKELLKSFESLKKNNFDSLCQQINVQYLDLRLYKFEKTLGYNKLPRNFRFVRWTGSFWYRRYLEGNMEVVHEILKRIKTHYDNLKD